MAFCVLTSKTTATTGGPIVVRAKTLVSKTPTTKTTKTP